MGYNTSVEGSIAITPPLNWSQIKDSPFNPERGRLDGMDVVFAVDEETVDTHEGTLTRRTAEALVPAWEEAYKAYNLVKHVQQVIDAFPGHDFTGHLECEGEENADMWRVVVRDGRAVKVTPRIVWPEDGDA